MTDLVRMSHEAHDLGVSDGRAGRLRTAFEVAEAVGYEADRYPYHLARCYLDGHALGVVQADAQRATLTAGGSR